MSPNLAFLTLLSALLLVHIALADILPTRPSQAVAVKGRLLCKGEPAGEIRVKLYDHDTFTLDDKIDDGYTDADGNYKLSGHANEVSRITPKSYITEGDTPDKVYDAGVTELSGKVDGESRDCIHRK